MNALKIKNFNQHVFAVRLKEVLTLKRQSLEQLSNEMTISKEALQSMIDGQTPMNLPQLATLATALEISASWLAFGIGEPYLPTAEEALKLYSEDVSLTPAELQAKYSTWRPAEHPLLNQATWISEVDAGHTLAGYWDWVHEKLDTIK